MNSLCVNKKTKNIWIFHQTDTKLNKVIFDNENMQF